MVKKITKLVLALSAASLASLVYAALTGTITKFSLQDCSVDPSDYATHLQPLEHRFGFNNTGSGFIAEFVGWTFYDSDGPGFPQNGTYSLKVNGTALASGNFSVPSAKTKDPNLTLYFPLKDTELRYGSNQIEFHIDAGDTAGCHATVDDKATVTRYDP